MTVQANRAHWHFIIKKIRPTVCSDESKWTFIKFSFRRSGHIFKICAHTHFGQHGFLFSFFFSFSFAFFLRFSLFFSVRILQVCVCVCVFADTFGWFDYPIPQVRILSPFHNWMRAFTSASFKKWLPLCDVPTCTAICAHDVRILMIFYLIHRSFCERSLPHLFIRIHLYKQLDKVVEFALVRIRC